MKKFRLGLCVAALMALMGVLTSSVSVAQEAGPVPRGPQTVQQR